MPTAVCYQACNEHANMQMFSGYDVYSHYCTAEAELFSHKLNEAPFDLRWSGRKTRCVPFSRARIRLFQFFIVWPFVLSHLPPLIWVWVVGGSSFSKEARTVLSLPVHFQQLLGGFFGLRVSIFPVSSVCPGAPSRWTCLRRSSSSTLSSSWMSELNTENWEKKGNTAARFNMVRRQTVYGVAIFSLMPNLWFFIELRSGTLWRKSIPSPNSNTLWSKGIMTFWDLEGLIPGSGVSQWSLLVLMS